MTPRIAALLTLPPLMWAGNAVIGRLMVGNVPPVTLNALRWSVALLILLPLGWRVLATAEARHAVRLRWRALAVLGLLGVASYNALQYVALTTSNPINVTLIASSGPVWMLLIGALLYHERPPRKSVLGAACSLSGVTLVIARGDPLNLSAVQLVPGDLLMLCAVILWGLYSWRLARPHPSLAGADRPNWNWAEFLLVQIAFGVAWAGAAAGVESVIAPAPIHWSPGVVAALLYVALGPSLIAYRCWGLGVQAVGPAMPAFFANLGPLFTAVLSAALLGEPPRPYHAVAFALIVAGIVVSSRR